MGSRETDPTEALIAFYRDRLGLSGSIPLHEPCFQGNEWRYVKDCIDTGWVSSVGSYVDRFERELAARCGASFAVATANGTVGLHLALHALGVRAGDLVVCPAISFVATANAIVHCGAEPVFCDVDETALALDGATVSAFLKTECQGHGATLRHRASGRRVAAMVAVHVFGHPADMDALLAIGAEHGLPVVEDAAEALGSSYRGRPCGSLGDVAMLSFNGNKTLTTGGGGALLTDDADLARRLKHLGTTARIPHGWEYDHDEVGYNYRMPNLNAALGCAQLESLDGFVARKRHLATLYEEVLADVRGAAFLREPDHARSNYWLNGVLFDTQALARDFLERANASGIQTRPCWRPLPELRMFAAAPVAGAGFPVARDRATRLVNLPSGPGLIPSMAAVPA
ncbi:aminotransferase DegT [Skermanella stibiiresistens SB22]|uniref:GDP-perosamine synthase n=1 Tax=Skermanella stibiiresistens SB22 TaxID=1385369 RepID=W9HCP7_9PROT|nr:LegC family aminotransferase [Skermanella stibiiresistens]EWY42511.1 aminotransferase DegT [Skermanella stibiiresistens SB22]